jgi:V8-like Glu-specific endopeptidase
MELKMKFTLPAVLIATLSASTMLSASAQDDVSAATVAAAQTPLDISKLTAADARLPFVTGAGRRLRARMPGRFYEVARERRTGIETDNLNLLPVADDKEEPSDASRETVPDLAAMQGEVQFEFFDLRTGRYIGYAVERGALARHSRSKSRLPDESNRPRGKAISNDDIKLEERTQKSWSNSTDNRSRRAIADGYSDTNSIYQRLADYGGCSATVLSANNTRMIAITAAHCIFTAGNNFSTSKLRPRRNGGTSPTWGSWTAYAFGYYPSFLDNDCEDNWDGGDCIKHDIALVFASRDSGATPPASMGWGYRSASWLDGNNSKYRRGYPGCSYGHSPAGCTADNLYGDGALSTGSFSSLNSDGWNRRFKFSSDINPGDSGSGLYYYRDGFPYVFGVTSAEPSDCKTNCSSSRPNSGRRITPDFYDFINSVM